MVKGREHYTYGPSTVAVGFFSPDPDPYAPAGSVATWVINPLDGVLLRPHADPARLYGCCRPDGLNGRSRQPGHRIGPGRGLGPGRVRRMRPLGGAHTLGVDAPLFVEVRDRAALHHAAELDRPGDPRVRRHGGAGRRVRRRAAGRRGRLADIYWTVGPYDLVAVVEAPDDETAAAALLRLGAVGNIRSTTMRAFGRDEVEGIIAKASA